MTDFPGTCSRAEGRLRAPGANTGAVPDVADGRIASFPIGATAAPKGDRQVGQSAPPPPASQEAQERRGSREPERPHTGAGSPLTAPLSGSHGHLDRGARHRARSGSPPIGLSAYLSVCWPCRQRFAGIVAELGSIDGFNARRPEH